MKGVLVTQPALMVTFQVTPRFQTLTEFDPISNHQPPAANPQPPPIPNHQPPARVVLSGTLATLPLREAREAFEREYLLTQINRFGGNISRTAAFVGMERSALHRKLKSLGVVTGSKSGGRMAYVDEDHVQQAG